MSDELLNPNQEDNATDTFSTEQNNFLVPEEERSIGNIFSNQPREDKTNVSDNFEPNDYEKNIDENKLVTQIETPNISTQEKSSELGLNSIFETPVAAAEPLKNNVTKSVEPSIKKEKPAENSDDTVYDITTGVPIVGTIHGAVDASDPRSTFNVIFGRNFVEDDASKKILAGKASEITKEDIENESVMTSLNASLFTFGVKAAEFPFKVNAAINQYAKYYLTGYNPSVEESEIAKVDKFVKDLPYVGDNFELSKKLTDGTLAGRLALDAEEIIEALALTEVLLPVGLTLGFGETIANALGRTSALSSEGAANGILGIKSAGLTNTLNSIVGSSRFATVLGLTGRAVTEAAVTNALIIDSGNTPNLVGDFFGVTPLKADLNQAPTAIEDLNRLLINKLKGTPDWLALNAGNALLGKVYNEGVKPAARIIFSLGESPVLEEAALQTRNLIKNDKLLEDFHDIHGNVPEFNYEHVPITLYSGLPVNATIEAISSIASKMKETSPETSYWIKNKFIPFVSSQKGLPEDIWKTFYESMNMIKGGNIPASHSAEMINSALDQLFAKNPELLNSAKGEEIHRLVNDLIHSGQNELSEIPIKIGETPIKVGEINLTPAKRQSYIEKEEYFKKRWSDSLDQNDGLSASKFSEQSKKYGTAAYKNKPIEELTGDDYLDYHKYKNPIDYYPERYKEYPGEHWTDRLKARNRLYGTDEKETGDLIFNKKQLQFKQFDSKELYNFWNKTKEFGVSDEAITNLINGATGVRLRMLDYFNRFIAPGNEEELYKAFEKIMKQRSGSYLASEYKIHSDKKTWIGNSWKPSMESREDLKQIIIDNAKKFGRDLSNDEATLNTILNDIAKASVDKETGSLKFITESLDKLGENKLDFIETNFKKLRDFEGKFIGNDLIQTEEQLKTFEKYLGRTTNVSKNAYNLIMDSAKYIARSKFYNKLMDINEERITKGQTPFFVSDRIQAKKLFPEADALGKLDETAYKPTQKYLNPFAGLPEGGKWYTGSPAISEAMDFADKLLIDDFLGNSIAVQAVGKLNRFISMKDTTLSLERQVLNPINYLVISSLTGNVFKNPSKVWNLVKELSNNELGTVGGALKPAKGSAFELSADQKLLQKYIEKGVGMTNLSVSNIEAMLREDPKIFKKLISGENTVSKKINGVWQKVIEFPGDVYVGSDNMVKFFNVNAEIDSLHQLYTKAIKEGKIDPKTGEFYKMPSFDELFDRAATKVQDLFPNYGKLSDLIKTLGKIPLFGQFAIWPEEMLRTTKNAIKIANNEMSSDIEKELGFKRALSIIGTGGMVLGAGTYAWNKFHGIDKDTQNAVQLLSSQFSQNSDLAVIKPDEYGRWGYIDFNHFFPYAVWSAVSTAVIANYKTEALLHPEQNKIDTFVQGGWKGIKNSIENLSQEKFAPKIYEALTSGKTDTGKRIYDELDSRGTKIIKGAEFLLKEAIVPPTYDFLSRIEHAYAGTPDDKGIRYNRLDETLGLLGLRIHRIDPIRSFDGAVGEYNKVMTGINQQIFTFNSTPNHSIEEIKELYLTLSEEKYDAMSKLKAQYEATLQLGNDNIEREIKSPLHQAHNAVLLSYLKKGEFQPIQSYYGDERKYLSKQQETSDRFFNGEYFNIEDKADLRQTIREINSILRKEDLNKNFKDIIDKDKYLKETATNNDNFSLNPKLTTNATLGGNSPQPNANLFASINPQQKANEEKILFNT
jgi:hypothetical protein